jgi:hypothetical protein
MYRIYRGGMYPLMLHAARGSIEEQAELDDAMRLSAAAPAPLMWAHLVNPILPAN